MPYARIQTDNLLRPIRRGVSLLDETSLVNDTSDGETHDSDDPFSLLHELEGSGLLSSSLDYDESSRRLYKARSWSTGGSTYEETPFISSIRNDRGGKKFVSDTTSAAETSSDIVHQPYLENGLSTSLTEGRNEETARVKDDIMEVSGDTDRRDPNDEFSTTVKSEKSSVDRPTRESDGYSRGNLDSKVATYANLFCREGSRYIGGAVLLANASLGFCTDRSDYVCATVENTDVKKKIGSTKRTSRKEKRGSKGTKKNIKSNHTQNPTADLKINKEDLKKTHDFKKSLRSANHITRDNRSEPLVPPTSLSDSAKDSFRRFEESLYKHPESDKKKKTTARENRRSRGLEQCAKEEKMMSKKVQGKTNDTDIVVALTSTEQSEVDIQVQKRNESVNNKKTSLVRRNDAQTVKTSDLSAVDQSRKQFETVSDAKIASTNDIRIPMAKTRDSFLPRTRRNLALVTKRGHRYGVNQYDSFLIRKKAVMGAMRRMSKDRKMVQNPTRIERIGLEAQRNEGTSEAPIDLTSMEDIGI